MHKPHVVITGSARGLGLALARFYQYHDCTVTGWDIVYGLDQDLWQDSTLERVRHSCASADIFFNCAEIRQIDYLNAVYESWRGQQNRCIVSIGTSATYFFDSDQTAPYYQDPVMVEYVERKRALDRRQRELYYDQITSGCYGPWLLNIRPAYQHNSIRQDKHRWPLLDQDYLAESIAQIIINSDRQMIVDTVIVAPLLS